jgi:hypothetical protein
MPDETIEATISFILFRAEESHGSFSANGARKEFGYHV